MPNTIKKRILFADDSASIRRLVEIILKKAGYDVLVAQDGKEALDLALANEVDAVVTDLTMPEVSGEELCLSLRAVPEKSKIPLIVLSGHVPENRNTPALDFADAVLSKDSDFKMALLASLEELLSGRSSLQIKKTA